MWRSLLLVTLILLVGCAGSTNGLSIDSNENQNQGIVPTQEIPLEPTTPSPSNTEVDVMSELPNLGSAPELINEVWLNTDRPLRLADLRGQVVLIDMWTFG
jgi:hypothetical protein